jgi:nucleoside 2-deoxyribosyltransferase
MTDPSTNATTIQAPTTTPTITTSSNPGPQTYTYYHAGPLFTLAELRTNIALSRAIHTISLTSSPPSSPPPTTHQSAIFTPRLPQNLEPRDATPHAIRDDDIRALLSCDAALFVYDGAELDAGTVVEYTIAKAADLPCVLLRTDFRGGGDQSAAAQQQPEGTGLLGGEGMAKGDNWNLMSSNWPRTVSVGVDSMAVYKTALAAEVAGEEGEGSAADADQRAADVMLTYVAEKVVEALREVVALPPRLPRELRAPVYEWLGLMAGFKGADDAGCVEWSSGVLRGKVEKGLL